MDGRDAFLNLAREKHWEFSSLRRAKFSTMSMLYELHNQGDRFIYCCNNCNSDVEFRWHCKECEVSLRVHVHVCVFSCAVIAFFPAGTHSAPAGPKIVLVPLRSMFKYVCLHLENHHAIYKCCIGRIHSLATTSSPTVKWVWFQLSKKS